MNKADGAARNTLERESPWQWLLRFVKGMIIISGAVLPGISGGVLAVVLGIYEPMMRALGSLRKNLKRNLMFFLPIVLGAMAGLLLFAVVLSTLFKNYSNYLLWFFIGGITGTLPSIFRKAGEQGRNRRHWMLLAVASAVTLAGLMALRHSGQAQLPTDAVWVWALAGVLMGLGTVLPGLSPSNFLLFLGLLEPLMAGVKSFDFLVIAPFFLGFGACVLGLAKLMNHLFDKAHAAMYHGILGIVIGSTLVIIPGEFPAVLISCGIFLAGLAASLWMGKNEESKERK